MVESAANACYRGGTVVMYSLAAGGTLIIYLRFVCGWRLGDLMYVTRASLSRSITSVTSGLPLALFKLPSSSSNRLYLPAVLWKQASKLEWRPQDQCCGYSKGTLLVPLPVRRLHIMLAAQQTAESKHSICVFGVGYCRATGSRMVDAQGWRGCRRGLQA